MPHRRGVKQSPPAECLMRIIFFAFVTFPVLCAFFAVGNFSWRAHKSIISLLDNNNAERAEREVAMHYTARAEREREHYNILSDVRWWSLKTLEQIAAAATRVPIAAANFVLIC